MKIISFGHWSSSHGRWFSRERIYSKFSPFALGWTPFVRISKRYKKDATVDRSVPSE